MLHLSAVGIAHPNIAFIKYWGNKDDVLRLPMNGSISMNLGNMYTQTRVTFREDLLCDQLIINGISQSGPTLKRVSTFLDIPRKHVDIVHKAEVQSQNNFPVSAGIASSASAFAALAVAASAALGIPLEEIALSRLARRGSGSACRSIPPGYTEWKYGEKDQDSYAMSIATPNYWKLIDCIAILETKPKIIESEQGHKLAHTSLLQSTRIKDSPRRIAICRNAILERDFEALAEIAEMDSTLMHSVMMTSIPPLFYWNPSSLAVMKSVRQWRKLGIPCFFTIDAGANVHVLSLESSAAAVQAKLNDIEGVTEVLVSQPGGGAHLIEV